jgi:guanylate kinase
VSKASYEISFKIHFDKIVVNDELTKACNEAEQLVGEFIKQPLQQGQKSD